MGGTKLIYKTYKTHNEFAAGEWDTLSAHFHPLGSLVRVGFRAASNHYDIGGSRRTAWTERDPLWLGCDNNRGNEQDKKCWPAEAEFENNDHSTRPRGNTNTKARRSRGYEKDEKHTQQRPVVMLEKSTLSRHNNSLPEGQCRQTKEQLKCYEREGEQQGKTVNVGGKAHFEMEAKLVHCLGHRDTEIIFLTKGSSQAADVGTLLGQGYDIGQAIMKRNTS
jgi:hypothetical protein